MELTKIVEALIFAAQDGIRTSEIAQAIRSAVATATAAAAAAEEEEDAGRTAEMAALSDVTEEMVVSAITSLTEQYQEQGHAFMLLERADGWRVFTHPEFAPWVRELFPGKKPSRLSPPALETLAIVAYRQPLTKASIEAVRGVSVDGVLQTLLDRNILRIAGRADLPGRPLLYETTDLFLEHFGIKSIDELPNSAELRSVKLPTPDNEQEDTGEDDASAGASDEQQPELPEQSTPSQQAEVPESDSDAQPQTNPQDPASEDLHSAELAEEETS